MGNQTQKIGNRPILVYLILWVGATIVAAAYVANQTKVIEKYKLVRYGVTVQGNVTLKDYENHNVIKYSYRVNDVSYNWGGFAEDINKHIGEVSIGESVTVVYDPDNPAISTLGDAKATFYSKLRLTIFGSLIPTLGAIILAVAALTKHKAGNGN